MGTRPQTLTALADSPVGLATLLVAGGLADTIDQSYTPDQRAAIWDELMEIFKMPAAARRSSKPRHAALRLLFGAETVADLWVESGKIGKSDYGLLLSEVVGALEGKDRGERSLERLMSVVSTPPQVPG